ncbi:hypothetical protein U879_07475 [Defluviimonas sp. 20V17]|uniref:Lipoprotein n=1 Tax=Allgaiera indica TaxID=765699 RepID=A0AAN4ZY53_9RHOB|nr:hypothetical protein [Allgaiera indica]KDB04285.1 hypothetical protein U879_07475 [Defluviimonas sp. 20V17]GHD99599.1 hypothetical protein GCM10008024_07620 [Allgaiera indica]SDW22126.1 hypothetical protein SAMN05444006_102114 [Allgaiera indica]
MRLAALAILAVGSLAACSQPQQPRAEAPGAYLSTNSLWVRSTGPGSFRVDPGPGPADGANAYWCAAGEYAANVLGQGSSTVIYRTSAPPRAPGKGVDFSLSPAGAQPSGVISILKRHRGFRVGQITGSFCPGRVMLPWG